MINSIKVVIADDMEPILLYLEKVIFDEPKFEIVGKAKDGKELIDLVMIKRPDLVITDIEMPECSGIQAIEELKKMKVQAKYILITGNDDSIITCEAKKLGILRIIKKPILDDKKFIQQIKECLIQEEKNQVQEKNIQTFKKTTLQKAKKENILKKIVNKIFK